MGCHFLLQGIFLTQGLSHISCTAGGLFTTEPPGKPFQLKIMNLNLKLTVRGFPKISHVSLEDLLSHCASYFIPSLPSYLSNSLLFLHFQRMTPMHGNHRREFLSFFLYQPTTPSIYYTHLLPLLLHHKYFFLHQITLNSEQMGDYPLMDTDLLRMIKSAGNGQW